MGELNLKTLKDEIIRNLRIVSVEGNTVKIRSAIKWDEGLEFGAPGRNRPSTVKPIKSH